MIKKFLFLKKYPIIFKPLSYIYKNVYLPISTGLVWFYVKYIIFIKLREVNALKKQGLYNIKPSKIRSWRLGKGKDKAYRRYYKAMYDNSKVFIKIATNDSTVINEIRLNSYLTDKNLDFIPKIFFLDESFDRNKAVIVFEYIDNLTEITRPNNYSDFEHICLNFHIILSKLYENRVIHADIHKGNIMKRDGKIMLFDFGISICDYVKNEVDYVSRPGTYYVQKGNIREYDDAYSLIQLIKSWNIPQQWCEAQSYKNIQEKLGKYTSLQKL